jgi:hypothetical protein
MTTSTNAEKTVAAATFNEFTIKTDGTQAGTTVLLNGKPIPDLVSLSLHYWDDGMPPAVALSWRTEEAEVQPGEIGVSKYFSLNPPTPGANGAVAAQAMFTPVTQPIAGLERRLTPEQRRAGYREI